MCQRQKSGGGNRSRPEEAGQAQFSGMLESFTVDPFVGLCVTRRKNEPVPVRERLPGGVMANEIAFGPDERNRGEVLRNHSCDSHWNRFAQ